ncbi:hypothetical protein KFK09_026729 [Dendrobium nobile]|uniref:Uncharacterized protein n=1 Tax=Dendrobium nobile TaxID=94219 RepID=A0A8T3A7C9_DENNO|nr:hypothetical protein KFK09_026729 [Dendrobium nobile]
MSPLPLLPTSRVDLGELKSQLAKRLGIVRTRRYFDGLQRLLSQKLSKSEFNKLCFLILGRACEKGKWFGSTEASQLGQWRYLASSSLCLRLNERANIAVQQNGELSSYDQQTEQHVKWSRPSSNGKDGETLEHKDDRNKRLSPLQAPLGIPFCRPHRRLFEQYITSPCRRLHPG